MLNFHNLSQNSVFQSPVFIMKISLLELHRAAFSLSPLSPFLLHLTSRVTAVLHNSQPTPAQGLSLFVYPKSTQSTEFRIRLGINYNREFRKKIA